MNTALIEQSYQALQDAGFMFCPEVQPLHISDARKWIWENLRYLLGEKAVWHEEYALLADWLSDNKGTGLWLVGGCGSGKTLLTNYVIPLIVHENLRLILHVYDASRINMQIEEVKSKRLLVIDDIGVEQIASNYGNGYYAFPEVVDEAEKRGNLLIFTTNLTTDEMAAKYGERVVDRLNKLCTKIVFKDIKTHRTN